MLSIATLCFEFKYYQRKEITSSAKVLKKMTTPQSDMQCCITCMKEKYCEGVKYEGKTCSMLQDVKINKNSTGSSSELAWVDTKIIAFNDCFERKVDKINECRGFYDMIDIHKEYSKNMYIFKNISVKYGYGRKVSLTVSTSSSTYENDYYGKFGSFQALTPVSQTHYNFWHSKASDVNPYMVLRMASVENDVIVVEVDDRKDGEFDRFQNVEVSIGNDSNIKVEVGKTSCGKLSYQGTPFYK